jgi:hypothetical protein
MFNKIIQFTGFGSLIIGSVFFMVIWTGFALGFEMPDLWWRVSVLSVTFGCVVLLSNVVRHRLTERKSDPYRNIGEKDE